jgi:beta-N-acetylhexosaminidase
MVKRIFVSLIVLTAGFLSAKAQSEKQKWIDSVFNQLSESEKIGQLFMLPVSSYLKDNKIDNFEKDIKTHNIGGVLFSTGHPLKQVALTNRLQGTSKVSLLIGLDASHGLGNLLDSTLLFPDPLALGAIESDSMVYDLGKELGRELKRIGVNLNFAPVANLNEKGTSYSKDLARIYSVKINTK